MRLFHRRRPSPADLPPVSAASVPGPMHSGLVADTAAPRLRAVPAPVVDPRAEIRVSGTEGLAADIADVASTAPVAPAPEPGPGPAKRTVWPAAEPPTPRAVPLGGHPPLWRPGTYTVAYDRLLGLAAPAPLTVEALTSSDLAQAVARDVRALTGHDVSVIVDLVVDGGTIRGANGRVGSYTYALRAGGAR